jgi:hypothetical protein
MQYYVPYYIDPNLRASSNDMGILSFGRNYIDTIDTIERDYTICNIGDSVGSIAIKQISINGSISVIIPATPFEYSKPKGAKQYLVCVRGGPISVDSLLVHLQDYTRGNDYLLWTDIIHNTLHEAYFNMITQDMVPSMKLKKLIVVARHGPRAPFDPLPKLDQTCWGGYSEGELTRSGEAYCYDFGCYIKKLYSKFFNFDINTIDVRSSEVDRTVVSAREFIRGLFGSGDITPTPDISAYGSSRLSADEANRLSEFSKQIRINMKSSILKYVSEQDITSLNGKIESLFGYKVSNTSDYYNVNCTLQCYMAHNRDLVPNQWASCDTELLERLTASFYEELYVHNGGEFTSSFTDKILLLINGLQNSEGVNFVYISTHDSVVFPLALKVLGQSVKVPNFCSSVRYEMWDRVTRVYYDDLLIAEL